MATQHAPTQSTFLTSSNPAQVKRNLLASFTDVLLLPVTIVPRLGTAVMGGVTGVGDVAVQGIAMLNPQRWVGGGSSAAYGAEGYSKSIGVSVFEAADEEEEEEEFNNEKEKDNDCENNSFEIRLRTYDLLFSNFLIGAYKHRSYITSSIFPIFPCINGSSNTHDSHHSCTKAGFTAIAGYGTCSHACFSTLALSVCDIRRLSRPLRTPGT